MTLTGLKRVFGLSALLCGAALLAGCSADPNPGDRVFPPAGAYGAPTGGVSAGNTNAPGTDPGQGFSILRVGDPITISFADVGALSPMREQRVRIPDSGSITLPFNVRVQAAGKSTGQLEKDIRDAYVPSYFVNLTAIVATEERYFIVDGEVRQAGQKPYSSEMTVCRAIGTAGGFTEFANRKKVQLRRQNGQKFIINYDKATEKAELDLPVYPNDHIIVKKSLF
jgi:protein involved in polysaccharide export with SLBB domain